MGLRGSRSTPVVLALIGVLLFAAAPAAAAPGNLTFLQQQTGAGLTGARGVAVSPDGKSVYVAGQNADALVTYSRNASTGALTSTGCFKDTGSATACASSAEGLNSARFVAVSPDNEHVYVTGGDESAVAIFDRNPSTGSLNPIGCAEGNDAPVGTTCATALATPLDGSEGIAVSTNGAQVYVAAQDVSSLVTLTRAPGTGALAFAAATSTNLANPRELAVSPDGKGVYVASASSSAIAAFLRDTGTGGLTAAGTAGGVALPVGVAVSPDSKHVYAGAVTSDAVRIFTRNTGTSTLTAAGCLKDTASATAGCTNAEGLDGVEGVAVSPDGANVYAAGVTDDAVVSMSRTALTGALGALGCVRNTPPGGGGCASGSGLNGAHGVAVSPDGRNVYVTGFDGATLSVLKGAAGAAQPPPVPPPTACSNPAVLLVSCTPPQICGPSQSILPQCHFPTVFPTVCGPSNSLLVACGPGDNYVIACGGLGTILPACNLPPPQIPQVCGPSNTILPPCTGANNPILVCGPSGTVLPECNFGGQISTRPVYPHDPNGSVTIPISLGCPGAASSRSGARAAQKTKPKTCDYNVALEMLGTSLTAVLENDAQRGLGQNGFGHWRAGGNGDIFMIRARRLMKQFFTPSFTGKFIAGAVEAELANEVCCPPYNAAGGFYGSGTSGAEDDANRRERVRWVSSFELAVKQYRQFRDSGGGKSSASSAPHATTAKLKKPRLSKRVKVRLRKGKRRARVKLKIPGKVFKALRKQARKSRSKTVVPVRLIISHRVKRGRPVARVIDLQVKIKKKPKRRKRKG